MKILIVSPDFPSPTWGAGTRNYHLLKMLACKHSVSLLALVDSTEMERYDKAPSLKDFTHTVQLVVRPASSTKRLRQLIYLICGRSYGANVNILGAMQNALDALLAHEHYDVVLFENVLTAGYRLPKHMKTIIDQHNIEHELLQRTYLREVMKIRKWYNWWEYHLVKPIEINRCRKADAVLVTSERERLFWKNVLPKTVIGIVPNGVDVELFHISSSAQEVPGRIIFTGTMNYYPNIDAVLFFAQKCWPLIHARVPGATWHIVGGNPPPEVCKLAELPGVTVSGSVPDVRPYFAEASIAIVPLLIGSGTRLKILESLAMQKAVVSTSLGCEGLSVISGEHLQVADQPEVFAQAVVALLHDSEKRVMLGKAGRSLVETTYSWERCGEELLHILDDMNEEKRQIC